MLHPPAATTTAASAHRTSQPRRENDSGTRLRSVIVIGVEGLFPSEHKVDFLADVNRDGSPAGARIGDRVTAMFDIARVRR